MMQVAFAFTVLKGARALPGDESLREAIRAFESGEPEKSCTSGVCAKPSKKYERILNTQPGYQWGDAGGYCGSWSIQRAAMAKGAWISQQQVRDHTYHASGNDNEILEPNIGIALTNLKLKYEAFDVNNTATPQTDAGRRFMKRQLAAGNALVQMIMLPNDHFPCPVSNPNCPYKNLPHQGAYTHIEPVVGIMSDQPLTDEDFYDDDYIVHYNDAATSAFYRSMSSLVGQYDSRSHCPGASGPSHMCLHPKWVFSWAIQGLADPVEGLPLSLTVDHWKREPDTRSGDQPQPLTGTITIEGLEVGQAYVVYRWDSLRSAFDYSSPHSVHRFTASNPIEVYTDSETFMSDGTTYYRCVVDTGVVV